MTIEPAPSWRTLRRTCMYVNGAAFYRRMADDAALSDAPWADLQVREYDSVVVEFERLAIGEDLKRRRALTTLEAR